MDTIINKITEKYDENNHKSINFTGQTTSVEMDIDDPNEYKESINMKKDPTDGQHFSVAIPF